MGKLKSVKNWLLATHTVKSNGTILLATRKYEVKQILKVMVMINIRISGF